jgi:Uma2 family endonuclease
MSLMTASLTADEFLAGDYPVGSELINGEVFVNDPAFPHQEIAGRIYVALVLWTRSKRGRGRAGYGGNWVLADGHVYKPDVWWTAARPTGSRHSGPPDLAVEVRSPGTWHRDIGPKLHQYQVSRTPELWLVDSPAHTVLVFRGPDFRSGVELAAGQQLTTPLLPGFAVGVDELFADID